MDSFRYLSDEFWESRDEIGGVPMAYECPYCHEEEAMAGYGLVAGGHGPYELCGACGYLFASLEDDDGNQIREIERIPSRRAIRKGQMRCILLRRMRDRVRADRPKFDWLF